MTDEWVDVEEDMPLLGKGYSRCSVDIDILMADGTIHTNGFCTVDDEQFYAKNGKHLEYKKVKGWRTR